MIYSKIRALLFGAVLLTSLSANGQELKIFDRFGDFAKIYLRDRGDTLTVVNFWATWCKPCIVELPYFEELYEKYHDKKLKVVLVSLDFKSQLKSHLMPFLEKRKIKTEVVLLADTVYDDWLALVDADWSGAIPGTLLVQNGKRTFAEQEFDSCHDLEQFINNFTEKH